MDEAIGKSVHKKRDSIGRFRLVRSLGEGTQGKVFLAHDPNLDRSVAIKTLHVSPANRASMAKMLAREARTVSKLSHPNVVTLFDAGELEGEPYLVFEYVEGETLDCRLSRQGAFSSSRAVEVAIEILEGVASAHQQGILHRDLKPANIIFDKSGRARIMDFGIAIPLSEASDDGLFACTPLYAAPEYVESGCYRTESDVYSVSAMLYEMLTGETAVRNGQTGEILRNVVKGKVVPPSQKNPDVDEKLNAVVLRGLAKSPEDRYRSAKDMIEGLRAYLAPEVEEQAEGTATSTTIDFLLRRMRHKQEFPALSETIRMINRIVESDTESATALSKIILKDFALTNKLLKLVNTAIYGYSGKVNTISRAVVIVGFEAIRSMAVTLVFINHLQNKSQVENLKEEIIGSLFSGALTREIIGSSNTSESETAFICGIYQSLGKLLAMYYFHDEAQEISRITEQEKIDERKAANRVLGVSYEQLGMEIAQTWSFPADIVNSMKKIQDRVPKQVTSLEDRIHVAANMASEIRQIITKTSNKNVAKELKEIIERYGKSTSVSEKQLTQITKNALKIVADEAKVLNINIKKSAVANAAHTWIMGQDEDSALASVSSINDENELDDTLILESLEDDVDLSEKPVDSITVLTAGIQDITETLISKYELNDLLQMIIETMYRGMEFSRVLLAIRDAQTNIVKGRFGLGNNVDELTAAFQFKLGDSQDLFKAAMQQGRDIFIIDTQTGNIQDRLPSWYAQSVNSPSFILFPIIVNDKPVGLFYADQLQPGVLKMRKSELNLIATLRNQAVLAFRQRV